MILYSAKEYFNFLIGSLILFAAIYLSPFGVYFDDYTLLLLSIMIVIIVSNPIRNKIVSSLRCDSRCLNSRPFFLSVVTMFFLYLVSDYAGGGDLFTYGVASFIRGTVFSPIVEEVFFRVIFLGYLMSFLKKPIFSYFLISIVFAFFHDSEMFVYTFFFSFILCFVRVCCKSVLPCVVIHSLHNASIFLIDGVFDNRL